MRSLRGGCVGPAVLLAALAWGSLVSAAGAAGHANASPFSTSLVQTIHQVVDLIPMAADGRNSRDVKHLNQALQQLLLVLERRPTPGGALAAGMGSLGPANGRNGCNGAKGANGVNGGKGGKANDVNKAGVAIGAMVGQKGGGKGNGGGLVAKQAAAGKAVGGMVGQKGAKGKAMQPGQGKDAIAKNGVGAKAAPVGGLVGQKGGAQVGFGKAAGGKAPQGAAMLGKQGKNGNGKTAANAFAGLQPRQIAAAGAFGRGLGQAHPQANKGKKR